MKPGLVATLESVEGLRFRTENVRIEVSHTHQQVNPTRIAEGTQSINNRHPDRDGVASDELFEEGQYVV